MPADQSLRRLPHRALTAAGLVLGRVKRTDRLCKVVRIVVATAQAMRIAMRAALVSQLLEGHTAQDWRPWQKSGGPQSPSRQNPATLRLPC